MSTSSRRDFLKKAAATLAVGVSSSALASENPFGFAKLEQGYENQVADGHMEGKCGGNKAHEGKCGGNKAKEGKCGGNKAHEGKCGGSKAKEGKCGGNKAHEGKCGGSKNKEGKCGEGKCGSTS